MSLIQPTTKNTDKKKKGNILQFLKKIDNTDLLDSTHNINKQQIQENICDDEFEKNNKEFFESVKQVKQVKQVKLKDKINKTEENNNKLSKLDKYKQFKNIDPDFTIQKYDINLKSNTISHLTFEEIEYKFCSQCVKWNNITNYHIYNSAVDKLNKYCKSCSNQLKKNNENANLSTKKWKKENKEKITVYNKKYREENREKLLESSRKSQEEKEEDNVIKNRKSKYYQDFITFLSEF